MRIILSLLEGTVSVFITLLVLLFFTEGIINFKPLYYYEINNLNLVQEFNNHIQNNNEAFKPLNYNEVKENYNYIISYVEGNYSDNFSMPSIPSSSSGKEHFKEVRNILKSVRLIMIFLFVFSALGIFICSKEHKNSYLKWSGIELAAITLIPLLISLITFNKLFNAFHRTLFSNTNWIFDPKYDPVILILPEKYFMHCALSIFISSMFTGFLFLLLNSLIRKNKN